MSKKFTTTILLVLLSGIYAIAQTPASSELDALFPEPKTWSYGAQLNQGQQLFSNPNIDGFSTSDYRLEAMFFADYRLNEKSSLRAELFYTPTNSQAIGLNTTYNYQIGERWELFGGAGVYVTDYAYDDSLFNDPDLNYRHFNATGILGVRYHANKDVFIDLRYTRDLLSPVANTNSEFNPGASNSFTLGLGLKF